MKYKKFKKMTNHTSVEIENWGGALFFVVFHDRELEWGKKK